MAALALSISAFVAVSAPAGAAGFSYGGGATGGTNVPISSLKILIALPLSSKAVNLTIKAPAKPTASNPARVVIKVHVPKGTFSKGYTLVLAAPPASLPALYYLDGATTFSSTRGPSRAHVSPVSPGIEAAALSVHNLASVYVGVYFKKKERTKKFVHPVTVTFSSPSISKKDSLFETKGFRWSSAQGAKVAKGYASINLTTNHALALVQVLKNLDTVSFEDNGGTGVVKSVTVSSGSRLKLPVTGVTRAGYQLAGWSLTGQPPVVKSPYQVKRNLVLKAVWSVVVANRVTISFADNGGVGTVTPMSVVVGRPVDLPGGNRLVRRGYHFVGWSVSAHSPVIPMVYRATRSITLVAKWAPGNPVTETLTYLTNGGVGAVGSQQVLEGSAVVLPAKGVSRVGYRFVGWSADGREPVIASPYLVTQSVILLAVWARESSATYSVQFLVNGGQGAVQNASGTIGTLVTLPTGAGLSRSGFTFMGWSVTGSGAALPSTIVIKGDLVLKAIWRA